MKYFEFNGYEINPIQSSDLDMLTEHRNDSSTWENLTYMLPLSQKGQQLWLDSISSDRSKLYFIVSKIVKVPEQNVMYSDSIGIVRIDEIDYVNRSCRVGCDVFKQHRGNGYSFEIMKLVNEYCFKELNMHRLWLFVLGNNIKAIKAYKSVGFKKEGVQRKAIFRHGFYVDYQMFSLLREEYL